MCYSNTILKIQYGIDLTTKIKLTIDSVLNNRLSHEYNYQKSFIDIKWLTFWLQISYILLKVHGVLSSNKINKYRIFGSVIKYEMTCLGSLLAVLWK